MARARKHELQVYPKEAYDNNIEETEIAVYTKNKVLLYGVNVSVARACAFLDDGLSPVRRRIIWTMFNDKKLLPTGRYVKVTEFLWETARYHPHGNLSIENTFGNMIKPWESNALLIDVDNNSGSLTGDNAAAVRYLDAKLSFYCYKCFFEDFDESIIDMVPNYIRTCFEPVVLPAKYPNFLVSLTSGIAWGNSIDIPPFNLEESFRLTQALLENPDLENVYLFPDSPRGYDVIDDGTIVKKCGDGRGTVRIRARLDYHEDGNYISVTGFTEGTTMDQITKQIYNLVQSKKIIGISDVHDKSTIWYAECWIYLKKSADPNYIIDTLYRKTDLEGVANINFNFSNRTHMLELSLKDAILEWLDKDIDYKQRYYIKKLSRKKERKMKLGAIVEVLSDPKKWGKVSHIIESMDDDDEVITALKTDFGVNSLQAEEITNISLRQKTKSRVAKYKKELEEIDDVIDELTALVRSKQKIKDKICEDLEEGIKLFAKPRRCRIIKEKDLKKNVVHFRIVITKKYVKKLSNNSKVIGFVDSDDEVIGYYQDVSEDNDIFIADTLGKFYKLDITKLPPCDATNKGTELLSIGVKGDVVRTIRVTQDMEDDSYVDKYDMVIFTSSGIIKASPLSQYIKSRGEIQGILLSPGDSVCYTCLHNTEVDGDSHKLIYTKNGMGLVIDLHSVTRTDRLTKGVRHLKLDGDDIRGVCNADGVSEIYILTMKGYGKRCDLDDILKASKRKQDLSRLTGLNDGDEVFRILPVNNETDQTKIVFHMQSGEKKEILCSDIVKTTRVSKGKKLIGVKRGDSIVKIKLN